MSTYDWVQQYMAEVKEAGVVRTVDEMMDACFIWDINQCVLRTLDEQENR